ncbi:hypothetical protein RJT34_00482 [Clitoria ternatea]|uniref:Uncharacterized protein n=1 Tax=Clitoria ternatea TaxID=43366 RepID=A0AAN9KH66_CLITE
MATYVSELMVGHYLSMHIIVYMKLSTNGKTITCFFFFIYLYLRACLAIPHNYLHPEDSEKQQKMPKNDKAIKISSFKVKNNLLTDFLSICCLSLATFKALVVVRPCSICKIMVNNGLIELEATCQIDMVS